MHPDSPGLALALRETRRWATLAQIRRSEIGEFGGQVVGRHIDVRLGGIHVGMTQMVCHTNKIPRPSVQ